MLFPYAVVYVLTACYDLDLNVKEVCVTVGILSIRELVGDRGFSKSSFLTNQKKYKNRGSRPPLDNL